MQLPQGSPRKSYVGAFDTARLSWDLERAPQPFKCTIVPRSPEAEKLIRTTGMTAHGT